MPGDTASATESATGPIPVRYASSRLLLGLTQRERSGTTLFVPCADPVPVGRRIQLQVALEDCTRRNFYIHGLAQRARDQDGRGAGFNLVIQGEADERAFSHLLAFCARRQEPARRFSVEIPCGLRIGFETGSGIIRDLSTTGVFVSTSSRAARARSKVVLSVKGGGFLGLGRQEIDARVVWAGNKGGRPGFGAELLTSTKQLAELVRRSAASPG